MTHPKMTANVQGLKETTKNVRRGTGFLRPTTGRAVLTARLYYPGTVMRCTLWISGKGAYGHGQGEAGGGGYHKASAALEAAIADAGIALSRRIGGYGDQAMIDACEAIARAVTGKRRFITHEAHA